MLELAGLLPVIVWTIWAFVVGACVGSLLNVCIARLPLEKSLIWPGSRCGQCLQPVRWHDNIPLVSYWRLRGRCRDCHAQFSIRYFLVELLTASAFAGVFWLEVIANIRDSDFIKQNVFQIRHGMIPLSIWGYVLQRWVLLSFLIVVTGCDLQSREIPLSVTLTGSILGLAFSTLMPWPWPESTKLVPNVQQPWWQLFPNPPLPSGAQLWPFWGPAQPGLPFGWFHTGLINGLIGLLVGTFMLRAVRFLASRGLGREALGLGDADLMMMVGAFLGWQAVVAAFFIGALVALVLAVVQVAVFRDDSLPFGPGLAIGTVLTWTFWFRIGPAIQPLFFNGELMMIVFGVGGALLFGLCWIMGKIRGVPSEDIAS